MIFGFSKRYERRVGWYGPPRVGTCTAMGASNWIDKQNGDGHRLHHGQRHSRTRFYQEHLSLRLLSGQFQQYFKIKLWNNHIWWLIRIYLMAAIHLVESTLKHLNVNRIIIFSMAVFVINVIMKIWMGENVCEGVSKGARNDINRSKKKPKANIINNQNDPI